MQQNYKVKPSYMNSDIRIQRFYGAESVEGY